MLALHEAPACKWSLSFSGQMTCHKSGSSSDRKDSVVKVLTLCLCVELCLSSFIAFMCDSESPLSLYMHSDVSVACHSSAQDTSRSTHTSDQSHKQTVSYMLNNCKPFCCHVTVFDDNVGNY